jgi:hypothetical protein
MLFGHLLPLRQMPLHKVPRLRPTPTLWWPNPFQPKELTNNRPLLTPRTRFRIISGIIPLTIAAGFRVQGSMNTKFGD